MYFSQNAIIENGAYSQTKTNKGIYPNLVYRYLLTY